MTVTPEMQLGQFIPIHYHYNMLQEDARMQGFKQALQYVVPEGGKVLELGGGTGVLSFFAAQKASKVYCVEHNPELTETAQRILALNPNGDRVEVIQADAFEYLPPEPVDVVICEMIHVAMLREKQIAVITRFKERYLQKFGGPLPIFVPEACIQAIQPIQHSFNFEGYYAPVILFQNPVAEQPASLGLADPVVYEMFTYDNPLNEKIQWQGVLTIQQAGELNALRFITKNILAILNEQNRTIDWHSQYLIVPLDKSISVKPGDIIDVSFDYAAGADFDSLTENLQVTLRTNL